MAKEDIGEIGPVPKKRRQLEQALDLHLAIWAADESLTPSERRRVREERERRQTVVQPVIIGWTATREGLTPPQRSRAKELLAGADEAHHGDCVGGDEQFHEICDDMNIPVVIHPPEDARLRAFCKGAIRVEKAKPFLERNKDIVRAATAVLAAPKEAREPAPGRGQGTWSTVRYARSRGTDLKVIMPTGKLLGE